MIVAVKRNKKQKLIKFLSLVVVILMFAGYYWHMSNEMQKQQEAELQAKQAALQEQKAKDDEKKKVEGIIVSEVQKAVELIGQENVRHVKIIENRLILICELNTNLEPLMVRYGTMALVKNTLNEIIIAIDVQYILKSKLNV
ncbi:hypothetical protein [Arcobacter roscoffensis]|uniref:Uncharacterized protein n=1 Tax=Arcobacter roscoffensis TaxID=2961520 RepID=A0ABY5E3D9_9BACT|nr:hypothetical protein [Arcobacter roscoffensis]UTJ06261.1 hypothetical protein NJU99_13550 [Arcobacter roscoffensis]